MENTRIQALSVMLKRDGNNAFVRFALAMEYVKSDAWDTAVSEFEKLLTIDPDYAAAYYHGGQTLEKLGRNGDAREIYQRGLVACSRIGDAHTRSELQAALALIS